MLRHRKATEPQRAFWHSPAKFRAFIGGIGSGKTRAGCVEVLRMPPGSTGMVVAPTYPMLRDATLRSFLDLARRGGVLAEFSRSEMTATLIDGKVVLFRSADAPDRLRGPNLGWFWLDEAALMDAEAWLIMIGRLRERPGVAWVTSTPKGFNWMYDTFVKLGSPDYAVIQARTASNPFLPASFLPSLQSTYGGAWLEQETEGTFIDVGGAERFLPSMTLWDACRADLPPLDSRQPLVLALDAAVSGDTFACVGVTRNPASPSDVLVRLVLAWEPNGQPLDYTAIEAELRVVLATHNVVQICYDPYQLHQMAQRLGDTVWCEPFSQAGERLEADRGLLDAIVRRGVGHDGDARLRAHLDNADRKVDADARKLRIVKRTPSGKIDLAVALSMASYRCLELNLW